MQENPFTPPPTSQPQAPPPQGAPPRPPQPGAPPSNFPPYAGPPQAAGGPPFYYPPYGGYGPPPQPPKPRKSRVLRVLFVLLCLFFVGVVAVVGIGLFGLHEGSGLGLGNRIGILNITGVIGEDDSIRFWEETIRDFEEDSRIKAVVLRIDSPGGAVGDSQEIHDMVLSLRQHSKPVYVSMGNIAASGGYYIAAAADRVYALKGTLTGSVGVIFSKPEVSELTKKLGVDMEVVKSGRFKDAGSPTRPITPEERKMFDYLIDNTFHQFMSDILATREEQIEAAAQKLPAAKWDAYQFAMPSSRPNAEALLLQIADGRVYTGEQALELGLVDEIGTLDDCVRDLARKVGLGPNATRYEPHRKTGLGSLFDSKISGFLPKTHASLEYMMQMP